MADKQYTDCRRSELVSTMNVAHGGMKIVSDSRFLEQYHYKSLKRKVMSNPTLIDVKHKPKRDIDNISIKSGVEKPSSSICKDKEETDIDKAEVSISKNIGMVLKSTVREALKKF